MALTGVPNVFRWMALLALVFMPKVITGITIAINANTVDHSLPTGPGLTESLWCTVENRTQEERVLWFREGKEVSLRDSNRINASTICLSPVATEDDGVTFACKLARDTSVQVSVTLDVQFAPILSGEDRLTAEEGSDVTLSCHVKANPLAEMAWWKGNTSLALEKSRHQLLQTTELLQLKITSSQKSDAGTYTCLAGSTLGEDRRSFHVDITDKKVPFPMEAIITAAVVVFLTLLFAIVARREKIFKCFRKTKESPSNTTF